MFITEEHMAGTKGILQTLRWMRAVAFANASLPYVKQKVIDFRGGGASRKEIVSRIFSWIREDFQFKSDKKGTEQVRGLRYMLRSGKMMGDCDCLSNVVATVCIAASIPCAFKVIAYDPKDTHGECTRRNVPYRHVYLVVAADEKNSKYVPFDPTSWSLGMELSHCRAFHFPVNLTT